MESNIIGEALTFMVLGMGIVFTFLLFLVFLLKVQAKLINKYFPEKELPKDSTTSTTALKKKKVAAAIAAIAHHNKLTS